MSRRAIRTALALSFAAGAAAAQDGIHYFTCDLNGMPGQMVLSVETVGASGITWDPSGMPTPIPTGDVTVYTAGEVRSQAAYYTFRGENRFADFTDHGHGGRFTVEWVQQDANTLVMIVNPFERAGPRSQVLCRRSG
ncbi:MAG: hypothetical protein HLUCCA08_12480 [Rhodobacteraceae bacterium HLUCCA08]|nr:MAG: hypothetical protein HLUCCA08_12480 [Rhodobacteraceae bacterium HLUCCA08]